MRNVRLGAALALCAACLEPAVSKQEAQEAFDSARVEAKAHLLTLDVIELSTSFTVGQAVEAAAEELRAFVASQVACAAVSLEGTELSIDFGDLGDACAYRGKTYAGLVKVRVDAAAAGELKVFHEWLELTDGVVELSGTAEVTWSQSQGTRHVVHDITWTDADEGEGLWWSGGDRTQRFLDPEAGLAGGIRIDGERIWTVGEQTWQLDIDAVGVRLDDPVPQEGRYTLTTPEEKQMTLTFERQDESTIAVHVQSGLRDVTLQVHSVE